jgi:hypothetical protein
MTSMPRLEPMPNVASSAAWAELVAELDRWGETGRTTELWWRDDDAVAATPQLYELLRVAGGTPLALAVVPALATADLAALLRDAPSLAVLQHGWRHVNRATVGKKSEYPSGLPASVLAAEVTKGRERLAALFGPRALPIFVPPWNRIAPELLAILADSEIAAVSTIASSAISEHPADLPAGLALIDTHVDLTDWKGGQRFIGTAAALGSLVAWLRRDRLGGAASAGPIGILTHHMIMDRGTAAFLEDLTELVAGHRAARWIDIAEVLR